MYYLFKNGFKYKKNFIRLFSLLLIVLELSAQSPHSTWSDAAGGLGPFSWGGSSWRPSLLCSNLGWLVVLCVFLIPT